MQKLLFIVFLFRFCYSNANGQQLIMFPVLQADEYSMHNDDYTVKVRKPGKECQDLYEYILKENLGKPQDASMVYFDFSGTVEVFVRKNNGNLQSVNIRLSFFETKPTLNRIATAFILSGQRLNLRVVCNQKYNTSPGKEVENLYCKTSVIMASIIQHPSLMYWIKNIGAGSDI